MGYTLQRVEHQLKEAIEQIVQTMGNDGHNAMHLFGMVTPEDFIRYDPDTRRKILQDYRSQLEHKEGYLEKRKPGSRFGMAGWQKRWFILIDMKLFWSGSETHLTDAQSANMDDFKGSLDCVHIQQIKLENTGTQRKFTVVAMNPKYGKVREYELRTANPKERAKWVDALRDHKKYHTILNSLKGLL